MRKRDVLKLIACGLIVSNCAFGDSKSELEFYKEQLKTLSAQMAEMQSKIDILMEEQNKKESGEYDEELDERINENIDFKMKASPLNTITISGYGRTGFLFNKKGGQIVDTLDKGLVGRLGNEGDNYFELVTTKSWQHGNGSWGKFTVNLSSNSDYNQHRLNEGNNNAVGFKELWIQTGGYSFNPGLRIWAGKRFYKRMSIDITDFYFRDYSGTGLGVEGLMNGKLDLAYIGSNDQDQFSDFGKIMGHNFVMSYASKQWEYDILFNYVPSNNNDWKYYDGVTGWWRSEDAAKLGLQGNAIYSLDGFYGIAPGWSKLGFQMGYGLGANQGLGHTQWYFGNDNISGLDDIYKDDMSYRVLTYGLYEGKKWDFMPSFFVQYDDRGTNNDWRVAEVDRLSSDDDKLTLSLAMRPIYKINENFSLQFEAGIGYIRYNDDTTKHAKDGTTYKLTIAPTLHLEPGYWGRPQIRLLASYVGWENGLAPVADYRYSSVAGELRLGLQAETWF